MDAVGSGNVCTVAAGEVEAAGTGCTACAGADVAGCAACGKPWPANAAAAAAATACASKAAAFPRSARNIASKSTAGLWVARSWDGWDQLHCMQLVQNEHTLVCDNMSMPLEARGCVLEQFNAKVRSCG